MRGTGLGTALVRHCEQAAQTRGCTRLYLCSTTAVGLYRALGWHAIADEPYGNENVTILAKDLTAA
jgi:N-acetylglutamate synthase-like GNAT family acetyltransferase